MRPLTLAVVVVLTALTVMGSTGCHVGTVPAILAPRGAEVQSRVFAKALGKVGELYVAPERIVPPAMLAGALEELSEAVDGSAVREDGDQRVFTVSGQQRAIKLERAGDLAALAALLDSLVAWVSAARPDISEETLQAASLRGAVGRLDRWSTVVAGESSERMLDNFRGGLPGIGCRIGRRNDEIVVLEVYPGTPAAETGIRAADRIVAVDGEPATGRTIDEVVRRLRGPPGSTIQLSIGREGDARILEFSMKRRRMVLPTVSSSMIRPGIAYLRVIHLSQNSGVIAERALSGILDLPGLRGLVLDLRGNSGGSMMAAGQIADQFIDNGILIETRGATGRAVPGLSHMIVATPGPDGRTAPEAMVIVLIDHGTASSAELLAATLARHDRAILVGERTFGKGVMQKIFPLGGSLTMKLTVARSYVAGQPIPESGIEPDVLVRQGGEGGTSPRCYSEALERDDGTVADIAGQLDDADPGRSVAVELIGRYLTNSRRRFRQAAVRELCAQAREGQVGHGADSR
jgi:carboxyl-terminal processing protease